MVFLASPTLMEIGMVVKEAQEDIDKIQQDLKIIVVPIKEEMIIMK